MKKSRFLTLGVAALLAVSALSLAGCGGTDNPDSGKTDDDKKDPVTPSTTTETALVTEESLKGKLFAGYSFENGGNAIDPFTGEAIAKYNLTLAGSASDGGKSGKGIQSGTVSAVMPQYGDALDTATGFSFSYYSYSEASYSDWNVLLTSDFCIITYGNLKEPNSYPSKATEIGVGAYSAEGLANAKAYCAEQGMTEEETVNYLTGYHDSYCGYNAGVVEGESATLAGPLSLYNEMVGKWQFYTVNVKDGEITFYRNGALAYKYAFEGTQGEDLVMDLIDLAGGEDSSPMIFTGAGGMIDNLILGQALSAKQALALYNNVSGDNKTEADVILRDEDASAINAATIQAGINARKNYIEAEFAKIKDTVPTEESDTVVISTGKALAFDENGKIEVSFTTYQTLNDVWNGGVLDIVSGETFGIIRPDWYIWTAGVINYTQTTTADLNTYVYDLQMSEVTVTVTKGEAAGSYNVEYVVTPYGGGKEVEGSAVATLTDGSTQTITQKVTIPEKVVITYAITDMPDATFSLRGDGATLVLK